jgi:argininosuccinate lyase
LQEDKRYVFEATDTLLLLLPVVAAALRQMRIHPERMRIDPAMLATELADELVRRGVPFRQAHHKVGELVRQAAELGVRLDQLPAQVWAEVGVTRPEVHFDALRALARRNAWGGSAPEAVRVQLKLAASSLDPEQGS